ncbi:MAG TPA: hypothetical protein VM287_01080 [Egibacteraceae bacterium]|nr:hypothetical protein [Egibacteraceae bacterium]
MSPRMPRAIVTLLLGLTLVVGSAGGAAAQQSTEQPAVAVRVSPAIMTVDHDAQGAQQRLRVDNTGSQPLHVVTEVAEFTVTPEGTTEFAGDERLSAAAWVSVDTPVFDIAPGGRRDVAVTVDVPADAEAGERYVSVIFAIPPTGSDGNIALTHRVAAKLYIDVPGDPVRRLELGALTGPRLVDSAAARLELTVHNRGNIHRRFEESTRLIATAGEEEFGFQNFTVLGDSTRVVEAIWADPPTFCWCSIDVETDDGQGNLLVASTRILMFPLRLTLAALAAGVGLSLLLAARRRRRTQRLQQLLTQATKTGSTPNNSHKGWRSWGRPGAGRRASVRSTSLSRRWPARSARCRTSSVPSPSAISASGVSADVRGEMRELKDTINGKVDQLNVFVSEVMRVAREVGTEGKLGQAAASSLEVRGVWKDVIESMNVMAGNLTGQVRNIAEVTTAVANGD